MKKYKIKLHMLTVYAIIFLFSIGCTKDFDKMNIPPGVLSVENLDAGLLGQAFAAAQYRGIMGDGSDMQQAQNLFSDLYVQYFATSVPWFNSDQYLHMGDWAGYAWRAFYANAAPQLHFVEKYTAENGMPVENALTKIWKVMIYHRMTDQWGPIIYAEFGNAQTSVAYDSQESIYADFFKLLDEATAVLSDNTGANGFGSNDLLYAGSVDKWLVFANSLRLRLALRIAYADPARAKQEAEKAVAAGVMQTVSDNANVLTTDLSRHPHEKISAWGEYRMSATMESFLTGYEDPRLPVYFSQAVASLEYKGLRNGVEIDDRTGINDDYSTIGPKFLSVSQGGSNPDIKVMGAAEVYFLRAEGALRGWNMGGAAEALYNEGIRQSLLAETAVSENEILNYINSNNVPAAIQDKWNTPAAADIPVKYDPAADFEKQLEQIITQKWIAIFPDGWEAWSELRRTGYPARYPIIRSLDPEVPVTAIIRRIPFVPMEYQNNAAAVQVAISLLGEGKDGRLVKLWWDAKP